MELKQLFKTFSLADAVLCGIPLAIHTGLALMLASSSPSSGNAEKESFAWVWMLTWACLPVLSGLIGFALSRLVPLGLSRCPMAAKTYAAEAYYNCFAFSWLFVYGYLGFFTFAMVLYAPPQPTTLDQIGLRTASLLWQFPLTIIISLAVCLGFTAFVMALSEMKNRIKEK